MLKQLQAKDFKAIPHLETSQLMTSRGGKVRFSTSKPNVIIGPNGAGKSALLDTIAVRFLASQTGDSALDDKYLRGSENDILWSRKTSWSNDYTFLEGLSVDTDNGPVAYYRPHHIPGNERDVTVALMCGYSDEAREFDRLTRGKSSGQMSQALLSRLLDALSGKSLPKGYAQRNWRYGTEPRDKRELSSQRGYVGPWEYQAEVLKALFADVTGSRPLVLMDEPEQSLDARAQLQLWRAIESVDCQQLQVIVATHSVYPLMHPKKFNIIEAEPGYAVQVQELLG